MAENEEGTVTEDPTPDTEAAGPDLQAEAAPEPEPTPAPGVPPEDFVSVRGLSGRARRMRRSDYDKMKGA